MIHAMEVGHDGSGPVAPIARDEHSVRWSRAFWYIMALGLILRLGLALHVAPRLETYPLCDTYVVVAANLLDGRGFSLEPVKSPKVYYVEPPCQISQRSRRAHQWPMVAWPPGYPLFLAGVFGVLHRSIMAGLLANVVLGLISISLVFAIGRRLLGLPNALVAAAILAMDWASIGHGGMFCSETLGTTVFLAAVLLWLHSLHRGTTLSWLICGAAFGAAIMVRSAFLPVALVTIASMIFLYGKMRFGRRVLAVAAMGGAMVLVCLPWCVRNYAIFGRWEVTCDIGVNIAENWIGWARAAVEGVYPQDMEVWEEDLDRVYPGWQHWDPFRQADAAASVSLQWARSHPWIVARYWTQGVARTVLSGGRWLFEPMVGPVSKHVRIVFLLISHGWTCVIALACFIGCTRLIRHSPDRQVWVLLGICMALLIIMPGTAGEPRFRVPAVPLMALFAAETLASVAAHVARGRGRGVADIPAASPPDDRTPESGDQQTELMVRRSPMRSVDHQANP